MTYQAGVRGHVTGGWRVVKVGLWSWSAYELLFKVKGTA